MQQYNKINHLRNPRVQLQIFEHVFSVLTLRHRDVNINC